MKGAKPDNTFPNQLNYFKKKRIKGSPIQNHEKKDTKLQVETLFQSERFTSFYLQMNGAIVKYQYGAIVKFHNQHISSLQIKSSTFIPQIIITRLGCTVNFFHGTLCHAVRILTKWFCPDTTSDDVTASTIISCVSARLSL